MKTKTLIPLLIIVVLALSACAQGIQAAPEDKVTPTVEQEQVQLEVETQVPSSPEIEGKCIRNSEETRLFINMISGYCLRYPAEYDLVFPNPSKVMFFKNSVLNAYDPNFNIEVQPANGRTVEQAADEIESGYAIPGTPPIRTEISIGGEKAIALMGLSGQDPNRRVVLLHKDALYTLYFVEVDKNQPELVAQAEALYATVIQSFNFRPETNLCPDCPPTSE